VNGDPIIQPEAEADIAEAGDWYERQVPGLGTDFILAVDRTLAAIRQNPLQYQTVWRQFRRAGVVRFPYSIIYRASAENITVVACLHGRRNPKLWKRRS
jgi:toxin ParE1/3/4